MTATSQIREYRRRKRAAGICIYGGCWTPNYQGQNYCEGHREENRLKRLLVNWYRPPRRCHMPECGDFVRQGSPYCEGHGSYWLRRKIRGLCRRCSQPAVTGQTLCARHAEGNRANSRAQRAKRQRLRPLKPPVGESPGASRPAAEATGGDKPPFSTMHRLGCAYQGRCKDSIKEPMGNVKSATLP